MNGIGGSVRVNKTSSLFACDWHSFTEMCSRFYGAGEPCLCRPIRWDRILPPCPGELGTCGVRASCPKWTIGTACGGKNSGRGGIESGVGRDKWRWAYVKAAEQVCICRVFQNIPGNRNRFESLSLPVVSMSNIAHGQRSNNLNIVYCNTWFIIKCLLSFCLSWTAVVYFSYLHYDILDKPPCHVTWLKLKAKDPPY